MCPIQSARRGGMPMPADGKRHVLSSSFGNQFVALFVSKTLENSRNVFFVPRHGSEPAAVRLGRTPIRTLVTKRKIVPEDCDARTHWQRTGIVCYTRRATRHLLAMRRGVRVCSRRSPCTIHGKRLFSWSSAHPSQHPRR